MCLFSHVCFIDFYISKVARLHIVNTMNIYLIKVWATIGVWFKSNLIDHYMGKILKTLLLRNNSRKKLLQDIKTFLFFWCNLLCMGRNIHIVDIPDFFKLVLGWTMFYCLFLRIRYTLLISSTKLVLKWFFVPW